jgi:hypothetical protein
MSKKTKTTSMIYVLNFHEIDVDYIWWGAQLERFENGSF